MRYGITQVCREMKIDKKTLVEVARSSGIFFSENSGRGRERLFISGKEKCRLDNVIKRYKIFKENKRKGRVKDVW